MKLEEMTVMHRSNVTIYNSHDTTNILNLSQSQLQNRQLCHLLDQLDNVSFVENDVSTVGMFVCLCITLEAPGVAIYLKPPMGTI